MLQILLAFSLFLDKIILNLYLSLGFTSGILAEIYCLFYAAYVGKSYIKKEKEFCNKE